MMISKAHSECSQRSKLETFTKIGNRFQPLTNLAKSPILDV